MNKLPVPFEWRETLDRLVRSESVLWAGRPQTPIGRWIHYPLPLVPALAAIASYPVLLFAAAILGGPPAPWALSLPVWEAAAFLLVTAAMTLYARMYFSRTLYAVTDRRIWTVHFGSPARRPAVKTAESVPGMRIAWRLHGDGLSTFKISRDRRVHDRKKRTHLLHFRDVSAGRDLKALLVRQFIVGEVPPDVLFADALSARVAFKSPVKADADA